MTSMELQINCMQSLYRKISNDNVHGQMTTQHKQKGKGISYEDKSSQTLWGIRFKIRRI